MPPQNDDAVLTLSPLQIFEIERAAGMLKTPGEYGDYTAAYHSGLVVWVCTKCGRRTPHYALCPTCTPGNVYAFVICPPASAHA